MSEANHHPPGSRPPDRRENGSSSLPPRAICVAPCSPLGSAFRTISPFTTSCQRDASAIPCRSTSVARGWRVRAGAAIYGVSLPAHRAAGQAGAGEAEEAGEVGGERGLDCDGGGGRRGGELERAGVERGAREDDG